MFHQNNDLQEKVAELQKLAELNRSSGLQAEKIRSDVMNQEIEHKEKQISELKSELANVIASKVELDEINRENIEKWKNLQIELTAVQGLYRNASEDNGKLMIQNENLKQDVIQSKKLIAKYREEIDVIQTQVNIIIYYFIFLK